MNLIKTKLINYKNKCLLVYSTKTKKFGPLSFKIFPAHLNTTSTNMYGGFYI